MGNIVATCSNEIFHNSGDVVPLGGEIEYVHKMMSHLDLGNAIYSVVCILGHSNPDAGFSLLSEYRRCNHNTMPEVAGIDELESLEISYDDKIDFLVKFWEAIAKTETIVRETTLADDDFILQYALRKIWEGKLSLPLVYEEWRGGVPMEDLVA